MITNNIITSYTHAVHRTGANPQASTANAALFQSMLQSHYANSAFGVGSVGTKTFLASPFQMNTANLANIPMTDVNAPVAVSGENMQMSDYLDTYKSIYDKYAAVYGDGFEFTPNYSFAGNKELEERAQQIHQMLDDFQRELLAANIPNEFLLRPDPDFKAAEGLTLRETARLHGAGEERYIGDGYAPDTIDKLFYLEKYGLERLSAQEQIDKIMEQFGNGTCYEFSEGISVLYKVGAITEIEFARATSEAISHADGEEMQKALDTYNYDTIEEFFKQYYANIVFHMDNAASAIYDWEYVFRNQSTHQYAGRDALITKLFG